MSYPFTIFGTIIFIAYIAVVFVIVVLPMWLLVLKTKSWKWGLITPVSFLLIAAPVVEELWIQYEFKTLCEDAGVHIIKQVEVDGYYDATGSGPVNEGYIKNKSEISAYEESGFQFKEFQVGYKLPGDKVSRVEKQEDGRWFLRIQDRPFARYHLLYSYNHNPISHRINKTELIVLDSIQNEVIGRDTLYARYPGVLEGLWVRYFGGGQVICRGPLDQPEKHKRKGQINDYVLLPNKMTQE